MNATRLHVNHVVKPKDAVGFHDAVDTIRHAVSPFCNAHWVGRQFFDSVGLASLIGCVGHQDETELFDGFHKSRDDILEAVSMGR